MKKLFRINFLPSRVALYPIVLCFLFYGGILKSEPFQSGEHLEYAIRWGVIRAGSSTLGSPVNADTNGKDCRLIRTTARSSSAIAFFFPVDDVITSCYSQKLGHTLWNEKRMQEGKYHRNYRVDFYPHEKKAVWSEYEFSGNGTTRGEDRKNPFTKEREGVSEGLPSGIQDILSALYVTRNSPKSGMIGESFWIPVFDDLELSYLKIEMIREEILTLSINREQKKIPALVIRPAVLTSGFFKSSGDMYVWISNDEHRVPLKITTRIPYVGEVVVLLEKTSGIDFAR